MPLENFGAILTFAESLETQDAEFYKAVADRDTLWADLGAEAAKNCKQVQRIRREFVSEMILEQIRDFTRAPYEIEVPAPAGLDDAGLKEAARKLETRAQDFYETAADKLQVLPEVARALKRLAKKRSARLGRLQ